MVCAAAVCVEESSAVFADLSPEGSSEPLKKTEQLW